MGKKTDDARQTATADRGKGRVDAPRRWSSICASTRNSWSAIPTCWTCRSLPGRRRARGRRRPAAVHGRAAAARHAAAQAPTRTTCSPTAATTCRPRTASTRPRWPCSAAESSSNFIEIITTDLAMLLDVDAVALCLETVDGKTAKLQSTACSCCRRAPSTALLGPERAVLLRDDTVGDPEIFGGGRRPRPLRCADPPQDRRRHAARPDRVRHAPSRLFRSRPGHRAAALPRPHRRALHPRMARAAAARPRRSRRPIWPPASTTGSAGCSMSGAPRRTRWRPIGATSPPSWRSSAAISASPPASPISRRWRAADFRAWLAARSAAELQARSTRARPQRASGTSSASSPAWARQQRGR